jgi:hypothetical protein
MEKIKENAKAVMAVLVTAAAYLTGVLGQEDTLGDVTTTQWLGLVVFVGGAYGLTNAVRNKGTITKKELEDLDAG